MSVVQRNFRGADGATAGQQVVEFPDAQTAVRATKVLESWHRDCKSDVLDSMSSVRNGKVRPITQVSVPSGKGWWYLVSFNRGGTGHFHSLGVTVKGPRMTVLTMDHDGQDHIYEPGQDPMELRGQGGFRQDGLMHAPTVTTTVPSMPGAQRFEAIEGDVDPATLSEAADRAAHALVRGARGQADEELVDRVVHLADTEGLETLAELWSGAPADSLAGALWRLYLLRSWVYADPRHRRGRVRPRPRARAGGRGRSPAWSTHPAPTRSAPWSTRCSAGWWSATSPTPSSAQRRSPGSRLPAGCTTTPTSRPTASSYATDLSAARLVTLADQLEHAARLELAGTLA